MSTPPTTAKIPSDVGPTGIRRAPFRCCLVVEPYGRCVEKGPHTVHRFGRAKGDGWLYFTIPDKEIRAQLADAHRSLLP